MVSEMLSWQGTAAALKLPVIKPSFGWHLVLTQPYLAFVIPIHVEPNDLKFLSSRTCPNITIQVSAYNELVLA